MVCKSYMINGEENKNIPFQMQRLKIEANYVSLNGWNTEISAIDNFTDMPEMMKKYIQYINEYLGVPVKFISNGPARHQIISC